MSCRPSTVAFFILFFFPIFPFLHISHLSVFFEQSCRSIALLRCPPAHAASTSLWCAPYADLHSESQTLLLHSLADQPPLYRFASPIPPPCFAARRPRCSVLRSILVVLHSHLTGATGGGCISLILLPLLFVFFSPFSLVHHIVDYFFPNNFCHSNQYLL